MSSSNIYSKIYNPINNKFVSIDSINGKTLLKKYLLFLKGGHKQLHDADQCSIDVEAKWITIGRHGRILSQGGAIPSWTCFKAHYGSRGM